MDNDRFDRMSACDWDEASQTLFKCRLKRLKTMDFLLKAMIGAKTGESVSSDDIFEAWVPYLAKPSEAWDFARGLPSEAQVLQSLSQAKTPKGKEVRRGLRQSSFQLDSTFRSPDGWQAPH